MAQLPDFAAPRFPDGNREIFVMGVAVRRRDDRDIRIAIDDRRDGAVAPDADDA